MYDSDLRRSMVNDAEQYFEKLVRKYKDEDQVLIELVKAHRLQERIQYTDHLPS